jgi:hypothetical protein
MDVLRERLFLLLPYLAKSQALQVSSLQDSSVWQLESDQGLANDLPIFQMRGSKQKTVRSALFEISSFRKLFET